MEGLRNDQDDHTDHTRLFRRSFIGFGLTGHQKQHFQRFDIFRSDNTLPGTPCDETSNFFKPPSTVNVNLTFNFFASAPVNRHRQSN